MELASNVAWLLVSIFLLAWTLHASRRKQLAVSTASALALVGFVCMLLLPIISITDDRLEAQQATLPASAQTWHLASQDASSAVEIASDLPPETISAPPLLLPPMRSLRADSKRSMIADWLIRSHSHRPPPSATV
jgi:hypothetical protein